MCNKRRLAAVFLALLVTAGGKGSVITAEARETADYIDVTELPGTVSVEKSYDKTFLSVTGYAAQGVHDRSMYYDEYQEFNEKEKKKFIKNGGKEEEYRYQNTEHYAVASNEQEFCKALAADYKVIEVTNDLNLGFKFLESQGVDTCDVVGPVSDYNKKKEPITSPALMENGVSELKIRDRDGLTIFSENGSTIYHCEVGIHNSTDIVLRNLGFQGMNEFDDIPFKESGTPFMHKRYDWDGVNIYASTGVWIDHCTFGNCYDGTIDMAEKSEATISWCKLGVLDDVSRQELQENMDYMEELYQKGEGFQFYTALRDGGATKEQIMRFVDLNDKVQAIGANESEYDKNIYNRVTMAYNYYHNSCQRVPSIRSGNAHMFNCYINSMDYMEICKEIKEARSYAASKGCSILGLCRANDARDGATIGTDTCIFEGVTNPIIGKEMAYEGIQQGTLNQNLIVNSSVQRYGSDEVYVGSSWDNEGENPFLQGVDYWNGNKQTLHNFKWGKWVDLTQNEEEATDNVKYFPVEEAYKLTEGEFYKLYYIGSDELGYEYQIVPLNEVKTTLEAYGGCGKTELSRTDWLKTGYTAAEKTEAAQTKSESEEKKTDKSIYIPLGIIAFVLIICTGVVVIWKRR